MRKLNMDELNRLTIEDYRLAKKFPLCVVLDNVRSSYNVGSVFRTADAFRVEKIFLCGITSCPPHREIQKTALGATESVEWIYKKEIKDALHQLKNDGYILVGLEQTDQSIPIHQFKPDLQNKYALIFGHEVYGLSEHILPELEICLEIPQLGTKHSLNISVAAGIALYHWMLFYQFNPA